MARLPDATAFGARPGIDPGERRRTIAMPGGEGLAAPLQRAAGSFKSYASEAGKGAASLSDAAFKFAIANERLLQQRRATEVDSAVTRAAGDMKVFTLDLKNDPNVETYGKRFEEQAKKVTAAYTKGMDEQGLAAFQTKFDSLLVDHALKVRELGNIKLMDQSIARLDQTLEETAQLAAQANSKSEYDQLLAHGEASVDGLVQGGILSAVDGGKRVRNFQGRLDEIKVMQEITANPGRAANMLANPKMFTHLDPFRRQALLNGAHSQAKADRAVYLAEVRESVQDVIYTESHGFVAEHFDAVAAAAKGTKYEPMMMAVREDRETVQAFAMLPADERAEDLAALRTKATGERQVRLYERAETVHSNLQKAARLDPLGTAAQQGLVKLEPFDVSDPLSLTRRAEAARRASGHYRVPVSPLRDDEVKAVNDSLQTASADQVTGILLGMRRGFGADGTAALIGKASEKAPELALALLNVDERPELSREIVMGGRVLRGNTEVKPAAKDRVAAISTVFGDAFTPETAQALGPIVEAANALYAGRRVPSGDLTYDDEVYTKALSDVVGGVLRFNGRSIIAPVPGMRQGDFDDMVDAVTDLDLIEYGNGRPVFGNGTGFTREMLDSRTFGAEPQLVTSGPGRYLIQYPGLGFVMTDQGQPYELDLGRRARVR
jgi:hypothetical protein